MLVKREFCHAHRVCEGGVCARRVGLVLACDVERGAMVRACAWDGKPEGDVDGVLPVEQFDGDQSLVVVHCDDEIVTPGDCAGEDGVGGEGATCVDARVDGKTDGGSDEAFFPRRRRGHLHPRVG